MTFAISLLSIVFLIKPLVAQAVICPDPFWLSDNPELHGFDPAGLENLKGYAQSIQSDSLLIIKDGYLVLEEYWDGGDQYTQRQVWSVTKSITALIAGIAADQGLIATNDRASGTIGEWRGTGSEPVVIESLSGCAGRSLPGGWQQRAVYYCQP